MANLIIGLGGTGAKVVESFIHLCATGLGPREASVAFVDQDQGNGNTARSLRSLEVYMSARDALRELKVDDRRPKDCKLLRTELEPLPDLKHCHWTPHRTDGVTLAELIGYDATDESRRMDIAEALFLGGEAELEMKLDEGYRGRPHVGSAALLLTLDDPDDLDPFWSSLRQFIEQNADDGVRVFLCGSAFGGTGAAILPTLARRLRQVGGGKLRTGASLMLPYFRFAPADDRDANVAASNQLLLQSRSALQYYHEDIKNSKDETHSFDDLYLIGWDPLINLEYHSAGSKTQENPPLAPELLGALAAARFFRQQWKKGSGGKQEPARHLSGRERERQLNWGDLPAVRDDDGVDVTIEVKMAYSTWLRFCALWGFNYSRAFPGVQVLKSIESENSNALSEAWFRRHVGRADRVKYNKVKDFDDYIATALRYAAAMSRFSTWDVEGESEGESEAFNLWSHSPVAEIVEMTKVPEDEPPPQPILERGTLVKAFRNQFPNLIRGLLRTPDHKQEHDAANVYWTLTAKQSPGKVHGGLWSLVASLYECSKPRHDISKETDE